MFENPFEFIAANCATNDFNLNINNRSPAEVAHTARIKDAMREGAVVDLIHVWYELLSHYKSSPPYLIVTCLQTVQAYVGWIDISLVVNEKFMGIIFELLGNRNYAEGVVDCLYEVFK